VKHWSTLNEPWCSAFEGHMSGRHAPGIQDPTAAVRTVHHLLLGHGLAVAAVRSRGGADVGITLNLTSAEPADDSPGARDAARLVDGQQNRLFLDALLRGRYPDDMIADFARAGAQLPIVGDDAQVIASPIDWIGVNFYSPAIVSPGTDPRRPSPFIPGDAITGVRLTDEVTALGWPVRPRSFGALLRRIHRDYPGISLYVHENGAAFHDVVSADGTINDADRRGYIARHIDVVRDAVSQGIDVRGYFAWSLMDNYEWAEGYRMRFGIVHVDFTTQRRTLKSSAHWYSRLIRAHHDTRDPA
jgi:beta-glucosidase